MRLFHLATETAFEKVWFQLEKRSYVTEWGRVYDVGADGRIIGIRPIGGGGVLEFISGGDALKAVQMSFKIFKTTKSTKTLQTDGHKGMLKAFGLTKEQEKNAIEALKKAEGLPNIAHFKIMSDGRVENTHNGINYGKLLPLYLI